MLSVEAIVIAALDTERTWPVNPWMQTRIVRRESVAMLGFRALYLGPVGFVPSDEDRERLIGLPCAWLNELPRTLTLSEAAAELARFEGQ